MTELQEEMLYLQTITTIMNEQAMLRHIATEEARQCPGLDVEARILFRNVNLNNMKQQLISEILNNKEFYTALDDFTSSMDNATFKK